MKQLLVVLILTFFSLGAEASSAPVKKAPRFSLPEVHHDDLSVLDELAVSAVANALTTVGALQITGIPHFQKSRELALLNAAECLLSDPSAPSVIMNDKKKRISTAAISTRGVAGPMSGTCGENADRLRASVDTAVYNLMKALDQYSQVFNNKRSNNKSVQEERVSEFAMKPYRRFADVIQNGEHLEHLHSFYNSDKASVLEENSLPTLDFHTDSGLFIAMTTGLYISDTGDMIDDEPNGLYMQLLSGSIVEVHTKDDALIIMVGNGGARWLAPLLGLSLRAVPHGLWVGSSGQAYTRAWYGKMFLPPGDAVLPASSGTLDGANKLTVDYEAYRQMARHHVVESDSASKEILQSGCGDAILETHHNDGREKVDSVNSYTQLVGNELCSAEDGTGVLCWMQCMSVAGLPCGLEAECVDTETGEVVEGDITCPSGMQNCELQCVSEASNSTDFYEDYCWGSGVTMYMSGFKSIVSSHHGKTECINLLFEEWTLDDKSVFAIACVGVFVLGIVVELLVFCRRTVFAKMRKGHWRDLLLVFLHGINVVLSYFIMLVVMTYNVELFSMAVTGLVFGYIAFNLAEPPRHQTDPCCAPGLDDDDRVKGTTSSNPLFLRNSTTDIHNYLYRVSTDGVQLHDGMQQLQSARTSVLAMTGVRTCDIGNGCALEVCYYGDDNLSHHIGFSIGSSLGGFTVKYEDPDHVINVCEFFHIEGMTCGSCAETVRRAAATVHGVNFCEVDLKKALCGVVTASTFNVTADVISAIENVGFGAESPILSRKV